jgi:hypothetical protein
MASLQDTPTPSSIDQTVDVTTILTDDCDRDHVPDQRHLRRLLSLCFYLASLIALSTAVIALALSKGFNPINRAILAYNDPSPSVIDISTLISHEEKSSQWTTDSSGRTEFDPTQSSEPSPTASHVMPSLVPSPNLGHSPSPNLGHSPSLNLGPSPNPMTSSVETPSPEEPVDVPTSSQSPLTSNEDNYEAVVDTLNSEAAMVSSDDGNDINVPVSVSPAPLCRYVYFSTAMSHSHLSQDGDEALTRSDTYSAIQQCDRPS